MRRFGPKKDEHVEHLTTPVYLYATAPSGDQPPDPKLHRSSSIPVIYTTTTQGINEMQMYTHNSSTINLLLGPIFPLDVNAGQL